MKKITLTIEQLEGFAKQVYKSGIYGYLDLIDSTCNKLIDDLLEEIGERQLVKTETSYPSSFVMHGEQVLIPEDFSEYLRSQNSDVTYSYNPNNLQIYFANDSNETLLRQRASDTNFLGNQSERL